MTGTNAKIVKELVNREVVMNGGDIVEYILQKDDMNAPFSTGDIQNFYKKECTMCGDHLEEVDREDVEISHGYVCEACGKRHETKEEALKCYAEDQGDIEGLEESDMIREIWWCPFCDQEYDTEEDARECPCTWGEVLYKCTDCGAYITESDAREEPSEIYEWYFVTEFLARKLLEHGEAVIMENHNIWGRCCTGQAIYMDSVFEKIAEEMGILEGQPNSWAEK